MTWVDLKTGEIITGHDCLECKHNSQRKVTYPQVVICERDLQVYIGGEDTLCPNWEQGAE